MVITIKFKNHVHVIRPSEHFDGSVAKLVEAITNSNYRKGIKNYLSYDRD